MKKFITLMLIGIAALGLSFGAMAGVSDTGAYLGLAQTFVGSTDTYIGYTFGNVVQTSAFSIQFNIDDIFGVGVLTPAGSAFLIESDYGFGILYEHDVDALDLEIYANTWLNPLMTGFGSWDTGARAEFLVLPNPCGEVGPCYNPELKIFAEIGITQANTYYTTGVLAAVGLPVVWGEVGFEVHL